MRNKPFSQELEESSTLKELHLLVEEISSLLIKLLCVDRRTVRGDSRLVFNGRISLYSRLYRETRNKFILIQQSTKSTYYKTPLSFEDLLDRIAYTSRVKDEDEEQEYDEELCESQEDIFPINIHIPKYTEKEKQQKSQELYTTENNLINEFLQLIQSIMTTQRKIFRRDDPEVVKSELYNSLHEFLSKFEHEIAREVLERAYHDIRAKKAKEGGMSQAKFTDRVGTESSTEELSPLSPIATELVIKEEIEITLEGPKQEVINTVIVDMESTIASTIVFNELAKDKQDELVIEILLQDTTLKAGGIKKILIEKNFSGVDYDSVYYSFERVKKLLQNK
jgi:hypothetical protein